MMLICLISTILFNFKERCRIDYSQYPEFSRFAKFRTDVFENVLKTIKINRWTNINVIKRMIQYQGMTDKPLSNRYIANIIRKNYEHTSCENARNEI